MKGSSKEEIKKRKFRGEFEERGDVAKAIILVLCQRSGKIMSSNHAILDNDASVRDGDEIVPKVTSHATSFGVDPYVGRSPPLMLIRTCSFPIASPVLVFRLFSSCRAVLVVFLLLHFFGCGHPLVFLQSKSSGRVLCLSWLVLGLGRLRRKRWMWLGLGLGLGIRVRNCLWMVWYIVERWMGKRMNQMEKGVVNKALEYLAKDLGIIDNTVLQGWIVSALLVGATVGSFTGGALVFAFCSSVETMIIGRLSGWSPFLEGRWNFEWFSSGSPGLFAARVFPSSLANFLKMDVFIKDGNAKITANMRLLNLELDVCLARKGVGGGIAALFSCGL
ncbi:hypothetical protein Fmac_025299 [Flemingia macrophylla]|uniref:Uncharacterized protein n=1 Tax=Flemingia macrophylla TaxID=520843 RepID=A0ABD1LRZ6_9FABA